MFIAEVVGIRPNRRIRREQRPSGAVFLPYRSLLVDGKDAVEHMAHGEHACVA